MELVAQMRKKRNTYKIYIIISIENFLLRLKLKCGDNIKMSFRKMSCKLKKNNCLTGSNGRISL
jgi:hypothetical protein